MIINCLEWKTLPVYGDGQNIRDWLYVNDHCKAIDLVFKNGCIGDTYNIGGNNEIKNLDQLIGLLNQKLYQQGIDMKKQKKNELTEEEWKKKFLSS